MSTKTHIIRLSILAFGLCSAFSFAGVNTENLNSPNWIRKDNKKAQDYVEGELIVRLKPVAQSGINTAARVQALSTNSGIGQKLAGFGFKKAELLVKNAAPLSVARTNAALQTAQENVRQMQLLTVAAGQEDAAMKALQAMPEVAYVQRNRIVKMNAYAPNDPYLNSAGAWGQTFKDLWGHHAINAPAAWQVTQGQGVVVAVIDSGLDLTHPDIQGNIWKNAKEIAGNGIDDDNNGYIDDVNGWNFNGKNANVQDENGHGTHIAGTIAATGDNGLGIVGIAPVAKIMPVRIFSRDGSARESDIVQAVIYAADNGAVISNNSYGGSGESQAEAEAFEYAYNKGMLSVVAAGNENANSAYFAPANVSHVLTVGALGVDLKRAKFSNYGDLVDVFAPGVDILSLNVKGSYLAEIKPAAVVNANYLYISGTSMAAPHVAAVAALVKAKNPSFTPAQIRYAITSTAKDLGDTGWDMQTAAGVVDANKALSVGAAPNLKIALTDPSPLREDVMAKFSGHKFLIKGTAGGANFSRYTLSYAKVLDASPLTFTQFATSTTAVTSAQLGEWDATKLSSGHYVVRLSVITKLDR